MQPFLAIEDDRFDVDKIQDAILTIDVGKECLRFFVRYEKKKVIIWLEIYYYSRGSFKESIQEILSEHRFLGANYWQKVHFVFEQTFFSIFENSTEMQKHMNELPQIFLNDHVLITSELKSINILGSVPKVLFDTVCQFYSLSRIAFNSKIATEVALVLENAINAVHLFFKIDEISIIYFFDDQLKATTFRNKNLEDFRFNLTNSFEEINFKYQHSTIYLHGDITNLSPKFQLLEDLGATLVFAELPNDQIYSQYFGNIAEHQFTSLFGSLKLLT